MVHNSSGEKRLSFSLCIVIAGVLVVGTILPPGTIWGQENASQASSAAAVAVSENPAAGGYRVFIDPETRKVREPTPEEAQALSAQKELRATPSETAPPPPRVSGPNGAVGVVLDDKFMVHQVARKNPDGSLSMDCVTGDDEQVKAAMKGQERKCPAKEEDSNEK